MNIKNALDIDGWMSVDELNWLASHAEKCQVIVEFGCFLGRSTRALGDNCPGIIYAVDPWDGKYYNIDGSVAGWINTNVFDYFRANLADLIKKNKVIPVKQFSQLFRGPVNADLVFIDGDHRYEEVKKDIYNALTMLTSGGIIAGHDYNHEGWPGVKPAVDELLGTVNICDSIWWVEIK
jgi:predicted O-methyltransferase YrrM